MDSPNEEYLSEVESIDNDFDEENDELIEDVTNKITVKKKEKPMKLSIVDDGDEDDEVIDGVDEDDELEDEELDEENEEVEIYDDDNNKAESINTNTMNIGDVKFDISDDEDDSDYDDSYYEKFDSELKQDYILEHHTNLLQNNYDEIETLSKIASSNAYGIDDKLHKTIPILTKYEKARILGLRAKQIENGSLPLVEIDKSIIDSYLIANMELEQKKIPFIIKRPLPNGANEYWKVKDLEVLC